MRKIKLMALLLAALMIVTAFAGCAGVKQEDLDAIDDRVSKIEDLLANQNAAIDDLKDKVSAGSDNSEILDAIKDLKEDLEGKIEDVNNRVNDVEVGKPSADQEAIEAAKKAAQAEAAASIEAQKAIFAKNIDQYDEDTYAAITKALATALANVNSAATAEEVATVMADLEKALDAYKTYAMKLYDAYTALLGKLADEGAEANVKAANELLAVVKEAYGTDLTTARAEKGDLYYYPAADAKTGFDLYGAVEALCNVYTKNTTYSTTYAVKYVNDKGAVKTMNVPSLASLKKEAKDLVKDIEDLLGADILYKNIATISTSLQTLLDEYDAYEEAAAFVGGDALVALVTNADVLVGAQDRIDELYDAKEAYEKLNGRVNGVYLTALEPYKALYESATGTASNGSYGNYAGYGYKHNLTYINEDEQTVWVKDVYADVKADLDAWAKEYALSEANIEAIIADAEASAVYTAHKAGDSLYDTFLKDSRVVDTFYGRYTLFVNSYLPRIQELNNITEVTVEAVKTYEQLRSDLYSFRSAQTANAKSTDIRDHIDVMLTTDILREYLEESGALLVDGLIEDADEVAARLDEFLRHTGTEGWTSYGYQTYFVRFDKKNYAGQSVSSNTNKFNANFINLFSFQGDIDELGDDYVANRKNGAIYKFFTVDYANALAQANKINAQIDRLAELVEKKQIGSLEEFLLLEGEYINLNKTKASTLADYESANGTVFAVGSNVFVPVEKALDYDTLLETAVGASAPLFVTTDTTTGVYVTLNGANTLTIDFFNEAFPIFTSLINTEKFETAKATLETRIDELYKESKAIVAAKDALPYVKVTGTLGSNGTFRQIFDDNGNGVADSAEITKYSTNYFTEDKAPYRISLASTAQVNAAYDLYNNWVVNNGGHRELARFINKTISDTANHTDVFEFVVFSNDASLKNAVDVIARLKSDIDELAATAKLLTEFFALANKIQNVGAEDLLDSASVKAYAYTSYTEVAATATTDAKYIYTYVAPVDADGNVVALNSAVTLKEVTVSNATKAAADADVKAKAITTAQFLAIIADGYKTFYAENVKYVVSGANWLYLGYAGDAGVDAAVPAYEKLDLVMAKAMVLYAVAAKTAGADTATLAAAAELKGQLINYVTDFTGLENALYNYNTVVADTYDFTATDVEDIADVIIYNGFEALK